jgi:Xaa-Pro aminopeptidase
VVTMVQPGGTFTPAEFDRRGRAVAGAVERAGLDVLLVSLHEHLTYLTGLVIPDLTRRFFLLLTPGAGRSLLAEHGLLPPVPPPGPSADPGRPPPLWRQRLDAAEDVPGDELAETVAGYLRSSLRLPARRPRIGYEGGWYALSYSDLQTLRRGIDAGWIESTRLLVGLRTRMSAEEIGVLRRAASAADAAVQAVIDAAEVGAAELELAAAGHAALAWLGSEPSSFPALCGTGPRSGLYHPVPTWRRLAAGEAVEVEMTASFGRYNSNLVRTLFAGGPSRDQRRAFDVVRNAFDNALARMRPGVSAGAVDDASRAARAGYARHIPSRTGYSVGLSYPPFFLPGLSLLSGETRALEPGMVFSLEPSVSGHKGETVILGCNVLITESSPEILNACTRELISC